VGGYAAIKALALARQQPLSASLELTYACALRCGFCYNPPGRDRQTLSRMEWRPVLDDLRLLGTTFITLTGGDPMCHPEFFAIARDVRDRAFALIIFTNGMIIDAEVAKSLAGLSPLRVDLSLHGATPAVHDEVTRIAGSFDAVRDAVGYLRQEGVRVWLKTPVTSSNHRQLEELIGLAAQWEVPINLDTVITPRSDGDRGPLAWSVRAGDIPKLVELLSSTARLPPPVVREADGVCCGVGRIGVAIDPVGDVFPCLQWRKSSLGNVRERRILDLWCDSRARQEATEAAERSNRALMRAEEALATFPFCPALALQETGEVTGVSVAHRLLAEAIHRQRTLRQET
jgi:MoaA/NifB/PqqE/SkfB family radical SAM enzyme